MNLFKGKTPKIEPPMRMPDMQDKSVMEARRQRIQRDRQRGGRDSTIMSDNLVGTTGKLGQ